MAMQKPAPFDPYSKNYNQVHNEHLPAGMTHEQFLDQKLHWVSKQIDQNHEFTLLDFGCNQGELGIALQPHYPKAIFYGIDESQAALETARTNAKSLSSQISFFQNLAEIDPNVKFDFITLFNVLHHISPQEREGVLIAIKNRLKENGSLLIWEHNRWNPLTRLLVKICPFDEGVVLVSASGLKKTLKKIGLQDQSFEYTNITPPKWHHFSFISFLEKLFASLPVGAQFRIKTKIASKKP